MKRTAREEEGKARQDMVEAALKADREAALRDMFAAAALSGIVAKGGWSKENAARIAYEHADAMLTARKAGS